jgi:hypothetical protein
MFQKIGNAHYAWKLVKYLQLLLVDTYFVGNVSLIGAEPSQNVPYAGKRLKRID